MGVSDIIMGNENFGVIESPNKLKDYDFDMVVGASNNEIDLKLEYPNSMIDKITEIDIKWKPDFVRNQETTSMCVAFSTSSIIQAFKKKETGQTVMKSAAWVYGICRTHISEGMVIVNALDNIIKFGDCDAKDFEYLGLCNEVVLESKKVYDKLKDTALDDRIKGYLRLDGCNQEETFRNIKRCLLKYQMPILITTSRFGSSHAIADVGIKKDELWCLNSWGEKFGDVGYFSLSVDDIDSAYMLIDDENMLIPFTDVLKDEWYFKAVKSTFYSGLMNGKSNGIFEPNSVITRAEMAQTMHNIISKLGLHLPTKNNITFTDVKSSEWYYIAVQNICSLGVMNGISSNLFEPERGLTRAESCQVIYNFINLCGYVDKLINIRSDNNFNDVPNTEWYYNAINKLYKLGLVNGIDDVIFSPDKVLLRCEMAQLLYNLISKIDDLIEPK